MKRCLLVLAAAALAVALCRPGGAWAALFLEFSRSQAAPGTVVSVHTGGKGALSPIRSPVTPLRVFLVPADQAAAITSPEDGRLILLGDLLVDERGDGRLQFVVPDVPAGDYTTMTHCVPCAEFSAGRRLIPTGPFDRSFVVLAKDTEGFWTPFTLGGATAILLLGAVAAWTLSRRR